MTTKQDDTTAAFQRAAAADYQRRHAALKQQLDDADQLAAIAKWKAAHPNAQPLPLLLKVCLLVALGCALALFLGGLTVGAWPLTVAGAVLVALVGLGAWKASA